MMTRKNFWKNFWDYDKEDGNLEILRELLDRDLCSLDYYDREYRSIYKKMESIRNNFRGGDEDKFYFYRDQLDQWGVILNYQEGDK